MKTMELDEDQIDLIINHTIRGMTILRDDNDNVDEYRECIYCCGWIMESDRKSNSNYHKDNCAGIKVLKTLGYDFPIDYLTKTQKEIKNGFVS